MDKEVKVVLAVLTTNIWEEILRQSIKQWLPNRERMWLFFLFRWKLTESIVTRRDKLLCIRTRIFWECLVALPTLSLVNYMAFFLLLFTIASVIATAIVVGTHRSIRRKKWLPNERTTANVRFLFCVVFLLFYVSIYLVVYSNCCSFWLCSYIATKQ